MIFSANYWYKHFVLEIDEKKVDSWLVSIEKKSFIYIPWYSFLLELAEIGIHELMLYIVDNTSSNTTNYIINLIRQHPIPDFEYNVTGPFQPTYAGLGLTEACNLRCIYCHSEANQSIAPVLSKDAAKAAIDLVAYYAAQYKSKFEISYTGPGEPTMAWDLLTWCTEYAYKQEKFNIQADISMATNGIYGNEKRNYIVENFNGVSLSFDGFKEIQDKQRVDAGGKGSFDVVFETAKFFHNNWGQGKKGFRFAIRATITKDSVDKMDQIYDFFNSNFPKARIGFELITPLGRGKDCLKVNGIPEQEKFANNLSRLIKRAENGMVINSGSGRVGELKRYFCKALAMPTMNVTPKGTLVACQRDGAPDYYEYGRFNPATKSFDLNIDKINFFRRLSVDAYPECNDCIAKYHCAGECDDLRRINAKRCDVNIELVRTHLSKLICDLEEG